ncbi:thioredoxin-related transmembrane protein 1 [Copidosoma floridanum]|uniref:thioredoxin-related transmembrane protein 1 n=1 Tax=Copidosoma floridanum TaxID=29053 RepID=UPI0006C9DCAB|nr:thioredoxin-related transmembrane protein 1 [Copidosoma floridanum]
MSRFLLVLVVAGLACLNFSKAAVQKPSKWVVKLNESNWDRMLEGEWMVEFYAPWCPACKALEPIWDSLAFSKKELKIEVGKIDVTDAPGLSGRFMVTALPTIYHVKDGIFRQYKSPRDKDSLIDFVRQKIWKNVDPVSSWKSPTSIQMSIISQFFKMSQLLRAVHNKLMEDLGLPSWGSYLIFAVATIFIGAFLGLLIVCIIDFIYPPKNIYKTKKKEKSDEDALLNAEKSDEDLVDNVKDDLVDENDGEDSEEKSESDKTDKETSSPNVRKRRARKAD